jgi:hypothetical protein
LVMAAVTPVVAVGTVAAMAVVAMAMAGMMTVAAAAVGFFEMVPFGTLYPGCTLKIT